MKNMDVERIFERPAIVYANHFRFAPGETVGPRTVASRLVLWTIDGLGEVIVDGVSYGLDADHVVVIPWKRLSKIVSSANRPLYVGGAHIVPSLGDEDPLQWRAAHSRDDPLFDSPARMDVPWGSSTPSTMVVAGSVARDLRDLGEMSIRCFGERDQLLPVMRSFAIVMIEHLTESAGQGARPIPQSLSAAQEYCLTHLETSISTHALATIVGISDSALARQFVAYTGIPPQAWIRERRLERASMLLRTSTLRVGEVARSVGFQDPLYFSRAFSTRFGISPREFSKISSRL